jgi:succinate dehydrogenase / fumarate reductase iron-sulfur subunit
MSDTTMTLNLKIWRQKSPKHEGSMVDYQLGGVSPDMSFLEMIDLLNEQLINNGDDPVTFDHDCREGICGMCSMMINGQAHGPQALTTTCQLHMRSFSDGDTIAVEPFRARAFPIIKDLMVDRSSFDKIIQAGGFISANTGNAPDGNAIPISKEEADLAMDAAACIGCGACVASCPNASAMLFASAKISQFAHLPQGQVEAAQRAHAMVEDHGC